jgi:hypothetical protein
VFFCIEMAMAQRPSIHTKNAGDGLTIAGAERKQTFVRPPRG